MGTSLQRCYVPDTAVVSRDNAVGNAFLIENFSNNEKEGIEFKIEKFDKASKDQDKLLGSQITYKSKKGLGYNVVPPPHPIIYNRPKKLDLSYSGLDEFKDPECCKSCLSEKNVMYQKDTVALFESPLNVDKKIVFLADKNKEFVKPKNHEKQVKKSVRLIVNTIKGRNGMYMGIFITGENYKLYLPTGLPLMLKKEHGSKRFTWVFFLASKDETSEILMNFIKEIENLVDKKVKIIRSDNQTEFKNKVMDDFCREKGIKREYSVAKTPQQNGVAERRNRTLIEAARTMLADSKLPTTFWAEAVSTACYVQNRVLVVKPHNKTPYELFRGFKLALSFMRPFGCHVTILNTLDNLGKFDGKSDEGFFVGYSLSSKAFRVYNTRTRRVEENLHIGFLENKPMIEGNGPKWLFDIDSLTQSMNYVPVVAGTILKESVGTQEELNADVGNGKPKSAADDQKQVEDGPHNESDEKDKSEDDSSPKEVNTGRFKLNTVDPSVNIASSNDQNSPKGMFKLGASHTLEATHVEFFSDEDEPKVNLGNITNSYTVLTTPNTRIHKDHPIKNVVGDVKSSIQTRRMTKYTSEQGFLSDVYEQKTHDTLNTCLYAYPLSQIEPTSIAKALSDSSWVEAMQKELLQFKLQQGHRQEEGIEYEEVFALVARIEAIRLFLAYASFMGFPVYQMDVKSAFLYGTIEEEVYVTQPLGFKDPDHPDKVYKVVKALYGLHQALRAWYETLANYLLGNGFKKGKIDQTLFIKKQKGDILLVQVTQKEDGIFISQDTYVAEILKKFNYTDMKSASTLVDLEKPLVKDGDVDDVNVHLYRSMIGSLMYLTASRLDIMFAVCACARFQVSPKVSHLHDVKRIF
ncbi:retrovirus-related pol polyprotein from transposon TNT 1-94, partial [Tanacetum coccineum]